jgi:hypothetical protein
LIPPDCGIRKRTGDISFGEPAKAADFSEGILRQGLVDLVPVGSVEADADHFLSPDGFLDGHAADIVLKPCLVKSFNPAILMGRRWIRVIFSAAAG